MPIHGLNNLHAQSFIYRAGPVVSSEGAFPLLLSGSHDPEKAREKAQAAGERAAAMNADSKNAAKYGGSSAVVQQRGPSVTARVLRAAAADLPEGAVVDTTGAGDSFIGSVVYGLATGLRYDKILQV